MREKFYALEAKINPAMQKVSYVATTAAFVIASNPMIAYAADADAKSLLTKIIELVASLIVFLGLIMAVMGIVNYASSHSEGDGPAQNKAIGKIAAGVILIALSVTLKTEASTLVGYLGL